MQAAFILFAQPMTSRNVPPLEAVLLPDVPEKPPRSWTGFVMGSIVGGSVLLAAVLAIWGLTRLVKLQEIANLKSGNGEWPTPAGKQAEYRAIYKVPPAAVSDPDLPQIEQ